MAIAVSGYGRGVLSGVSLPVPHRLKKSVTGNPDFVSISNDSARRSTGGMVCGTVSELGFSSSAVALVNGATNEGKAPRRAEVLKKRTVKGENRQVGLSASSSSSSAPLSFSEESSFGTTDGGTGFNGRGGGDGGGSGGGDSGSGGSEGSGAKPGGSDGGGGILGGFLRGWEARVKADPQFAFKVLMEEIVGVGASVFGDMATRPNFGLDELDLVFSTLVVGSILNFTLMYMLAPTASAGAVAKKLPGIFASSPAGHMFETGSYTLLERAGTFVYKGTLFATVGFFAGLVGTGISTLLLNARKKMDPNFVSQNASPPIVLNAATWAAHMGLSSNARYQTLNGLEFALANILSPGPFKLSVTVLRGLNNVLGGVTFVALARLTGSQPSDTTGPPESPESLEPAIASS